VSFFEDDGFGGPFFDPNDPFGFGDGGGGYGNIEDIVNIIVSAYIQFILRYLSAALDAVSSVITALNGFGDRAGQFLRHLWANFYKLILVHILAAIRALHNWLEAHLKPIIDALKRIRDLYDRIFLRYIKPILNMLQHIRQVLAVLRALHINIGVALDQWISAVEQKIASTFLQFRAVLNNAIDLLNIVADPALLLRKPTLIISLRRILPAIIRAVTGLPPGYFFPSPRGSSSKYFAPVAANFNPSDPAMNPPPSFYLGGNDGIGNVPAFSFVSIPQDSAVDSLDLLDFFDDSLYPAPQCSDAVRCLVPLLQIPRNG
jgi:hypothetical protein